MNEINIYLILHYSTKTLHETIHIEFNIVLYVPKEKKYLFLGTVMGCVGTLGNEGKWNCLESNQTSEGLILEE